MSLEACITRAGKALTKEDAKAIRAIRDDLLKTMENKEAANEKAVDEYLDIIADEKRFILRQVEALGGHLANPRLSPSEYAKQSAKNLEEAARKFPRKGIERPPAETAPIDYKTGTRLTEGFYERNKNAPHQKFTRELLTNRTSDTVHRLWPNWYQFSPAEIIKIVNRFDPKAAMGLAHRFKLIPSNARSIETAQFKSAAQKAPTTVKGGDVHDWGAKIVANWIQKEETVPLYFKVEDVFQRDLAEEHPEQPMAVASKLSTVVQEAYEEPARGWAKVKNWMRDNLGIAGALAAVPQTKLKDFVQYGMPAVSGYTSIVKKMDAWVSTELEQHADIAKVWLNFNKNKVNKKAKILLNELIGATTLTGVNVANFEIPDKATFKKMNKQKRAEWLQREKDYKLLKPFWDRLGKMGEQKDYQQVVYDSKSETFKETGEKRKVSEGQWIYMTVRDHYKNQSDQLLQNLVNRIRISEANNQSKVAAIAALRKEFEAGEINPYFPLARFGKYAAIAKTKEGEKVAYTHHENSAQRNKWMREMRKKGYVPIPYDNQAPVAQQMERIDPDFVANIVNMVDDAALQDEIWQMYLRRLPEMSARTAFIHREGVLGFSQDHLRAFSDKTFHGTHQMGKIRFGGELNEAIRIAEEDGVMLSQRAAKINNMQDLGWRPEGFEDLSEHDAMTGSMELGGALSKTNGEWLNNYGRLYVKFRKDGQPHEEASQNAIAKILKEAETDGPWAMPIVEELKKRHAFNMNPTSATWSTKLTALGFLWFLSTSPAAGVLNLTQTAVSAYPIMRARFKGQQTAQALTKASKEFATQPWLGLDRQGLDRLIAKLRNDRVSGKETEFGEKAAMQRFWEIGIFSKTRTRELQGLSEGGTAGFSQREEQILEMAGYIFHKTEEMNRAVTALAAYRLAREKVANNENMTLEEQHEYAIDQANEMVEMSHYDYTNTNRPRFMQGDMGRVVFLFRNYSVNMQYRLIRDFRDGVWTNKNIPIEARREARSRFLGMLGMHTIFAGIAGMPLFWAVEMIANNLLGEDDDELYFDLMGDPDNPFDTKTYLRRVLFNATKDNLGEIWGEKVATAIMKGPWAAFTGADLSQRASLNNLWMREIPEQEKEDPRGLLLYLMGEAAGPMFGIADNVIGGFKDIAEGEHLMRGVEKLLPKFAGDTLKSVRYATQGAQTYQRDMIMPPEAFTNIDLALQFIGFTPTRIANQYEQNRITKDMSIKLRRRKSDLMNKYYMAWRFGDKSDTRKIVEEIAAWNKRNPRSPITAKSIRQSANMRSEYDMRTVGGVGLDERLDYLHNELRFIARREEK